MLGQIPEIINGDLAVVSLVIDSGLLHAFEFVDLVDKFANLGAFVFVLTPELSKLDSKPRIGRSDQTVEELEGKILSKCLLL